jgi:hypothetical protein
LQATATYPFTATAKPFLLISNDERRELPNMDVTATDPAGTEIVPHTPVVRLANTVYLGDDEGSRCSDSTLDQVQEQYGKRVVYCFRITNNGNSALQDILS